MAPDEYRHDEVALDVLWVWPDQPSVAVSMLQLMESTFSLN